VSSGTGPSLRTGYVEAVAVREGFPRSGCGTAVMDVRETVIRAAYELGALGTTEDARAFYAGWGWQAWRGATYALTPTGTMRTASEDGAMYVLPGSAPLDFSGELTCDWRDGELW
jgi:aminoglycoside 2'-N-acetyltransferase I